MKSPLESAKYSQAWKLPTDVVFKVNVNAIIFSFQHMCGVGVMIRDEMGLVVGALSKRFKIAFTYLNFRTKQPLHDNTLIHMPNEGPNFLSNQNK